MNMMPDVDLPLGDTIMVAMMKPGGSMYPNSRYIAPQNTYIGTTLRPK